MLTRTVVSKLVIGRARPLFRAAVLHARSCSGLILGGRLQSLQGRRGGRGAKTAPGKSEEGSTAGITVIHRRAPRYEDTRRSAGNDPGLRGHSGLFANLRLRAEVPLQHRRPRQGRRRPDRDVDSGLCRTALREGRRGQEGRGHDPRGPELRSGRPRPRCETAKARIASATGRCQDGPRPATRGGSRSTNGWRRWSPSASSTCRFATRRTASSKRPPPHATRPTRWFPRRYPRTTRPLPTATAPRLTSSRPAPSCKSRRPRNARRGCSSNTARSKRRTTA